MDDNQQQQQQQDSQQANGAAAAGSSSSSSGPCAQLLAEWRQSGLPEPKVTWKVTAADDSDSDEDSDADGDATMTDAAAAAAAARVAKRQRRLQQRQQQQQLGGGATGHAPAGPPESWIVLGIESSCDDTAAAVVRGDGTVLSHCIASQVGFVVCCNLFWTMV
jgi:hypothetical protein